MFIACRIGLATTAGPIHQQSLPGPTSTPRRSPRGRSGASASPGRVHGLQVSARQTQPLEPILFPKLRIYFADFPYLHCSIDQRLLTLETCCGYEYDRTRESPSPPDFQGPSGAHRTPQEVWCFTDHWTISPGNQIPWFQVVNKKREPFPGLLPTSRSSVALPHISRRRISAFWFGNINPIPFRSMARDRAL